MRRLSKIIQKPFHKAKCSEETSYWADILQEHAMF